MLNVSFSAVAHAGHEAASTLEFLRHLTELLWFQLTCCIIPHAADLALLAQCAHVERLQVPAPALHLR